MGRVPRNWNPDPAPPGSIGGWTLGVNPLLLRMRKSLVNSVTVRAIQLRFETIGHSLKLRARLSEVFAPHWYPKQVGGQPAAQKCRHPPVLVLDLLLYFDDRRGSDVSFQIFAQLFRRPFHIGLVLLRDNGRRHGWMAKNKEKPSARNAQGSSIASSIKPNQPSRNVTTEISISAIKSPWRSDVNFRNTPFHWRRKGGTGGPWPPSILEFGIFLLTFQEKKSFSPSFEFVKENFTTVSPHPLRKKPPTPMRVFPSNEHWLRHHFRKFDCVAASRMAHVSPRSDWKIHSQL